MVEKRLGPVDPQVTGQLKPWDCGPASAQIVLSLLGIDVSEDELIAEIGTGVNGTDTVEWIVDRCLKKRVPQGNWKALWFPNDPPSKAEEDTLWRVVTNSINAGYACIFNFDSPPSNHPIGTRGSGTPNYRGHIYHYVACTAWADDGPGGKHFWIDDPGFSVPEGGHGYWASAHQVATLIPPHAIAYADVPAAATPVTVPKAEPPVAVRAGYASVSPYRVPGEPSIGGIDRFTINDDGMIHAAWTEYSAMVLGDEEAIARIVRSAAGAGAVTDPAFIKRARKVLAKVPKDDLAAVLLKVQQQDPQWIDALRSAP